MATAQVVEINPGGNVVLICGDKADPNESYAHLVSSDEFTDTQRRSPRIRVSSTALSLGSPVFKALLAPRFAEGCQLAHSSTVEIPLPDDDFDDMALVCSILHHRNDRVPQELDADGVLRCAELSDKYGRALAVRSAVEAWILSDVQSTSITDLGKHLVAAATVKNQKLLRSLSKQLLLRADTAIHAIVPDGPFKPNSLCTELDRCLTTLQREVIAVVENLIDRQTMEETYAENPGLECPDDCTVIARRVTSYLKQLKTHELWPTHARCKALADSLDRLRHIRLREPKNIKACGRGCIVEFIEDDAEEMNAENETSKLQDLAEAIRTKMEKMVDHAVIELYSGK
ncbi:hypothetical protein LTR17_008465 [Elasticomyces elasticus]|nr:hypothetical protein LTR17_008465 [Elasticomyces elasticus]